MVRRVCEYCGKRFRKGGWKTIFGYWVCERCLKDYEKALDEEDLYEQAELEREGLDL